MSKSKFISSGAAVALCFLASVVVHAMVLGTVLFVLLDEGGDTAVEEMNMAVYEVRLTTNVNAGGTGHELGEESKGAVESALPAGKAEQKPGPAELAKAPERKALPRLERKSAQAAEKTGRPKNIAKPEKPEVKKKRSEPRRIQVNLSESAGEPKGNGRNGPRTGHDGAEDVPKIPGTGTDSGAFHERGLPKGHGAGIGPGTESGLVMSVRQPELIGKVEPVYPARARRRRIQGFVRVKFLVDKRGLVSKARVVESEPYGVFDDSAIEAVEKWRFSPAMKNGQPCSVWLTQPIRFSLSGGI